MLEILRRKLAELLESRQAAQATVDGILAAVETEGRSDLTEAETAAFAEARDALTAIDAEAVTVRARVAELEALAEQRAAAEAELAALDPAPARGANPVGAGGVTVRREERTYRQGGEHSFLRDAYAMRFGGDREATERLTRHNVEELTEARAAGVELRDVGTSAFGALVVPQYLTDLFAAVRRAGRPFLDAINGMESLPPEGMTLNIPRGTTGTATAAQATENSTVQETNFDETTLAVSVRTYAGMQQISRQAIERGRGVESIIMRDLLSDYHTKVDSAALNADGTSGTHLGVRSTSGINAVTYTDASPTVAEFLVKLADAIQRQATNGLGAALPLIVMHPRRWGWLTAAVDSSGRPLVVPNPAGPWNALSVMERTAAEYGGPIPVGALQGVPTITDANIPTDVGAGTEDVVVVVDAAESFIMEEDRGPLYLRFDETAGENLTVTAVVYGYSAFTCGRYPSLVSVISGTGLIAPTF